MRKPVHGKGMLRSGNPENAGGPGRPSSIVREELRGSFADRRGVLEDIADGEAVQRIEVPLFLVLPHARCPKCKGKLKEARRTGGELVVLEGKVSASPGDRIRALDVMGKYGLGANQEFTEDAIKARIGDMLRRIRAEFAPDVAEHIIATIKPSWR